MKILIFRKDNIGDLILTTPLFVALRELYPDAYISALCHDYTKDILTPFPEIDEVYCYSKAKHQAATNKLLAFARSVVTYLRIRRKKFDVLIYVGDGSDRRILRRLLFMNPIKIVTFGDPQNTTHRVVYLDSPSVNRGPEAVEIYKLLSFFGIQRPLRYTDLRVYRSQTRFFQEFAEEKALYKLHLHLSARKESQQWRVENYVKLISLVVREFPEAIVRVTWAPGHIDTKGHQGDDIKALQLRELLDPKDLVRCKFLRTTSLQHLKDALFLADISVTPDGGAMHLAAALKIPTVALFGRSDASRWGPWGVPNRVLQKASHDVNDINPQEVFDQTLILLKVYYPQWGRPSYAH